MDPAAAAGSDQRVALIGEAAMKTKTKTSTSLKILAHVLFGLSIAIGLAGTPLLAQGGADALHCSGCDE